MSDNADSKSGLAPFLTRFTAPVLGIIALITGIHGFIKLFGEKDAGLLTLISLVVGILLLLGICLYYARFWKPEKGDKSQSAFVRPDDEAIKAQQQKENRRRFVRRSAIAGLVLIPLLSIAGVAGWQYAQTLPPKEVLILLADFEDSGSQNYFVTKTIYGNLEAATEKYDDVTAKRLNKTIQDRETAQEEGKKQKARIVIWGSFGKTEKVVPISVNFELLNSPKDKDSEDYLPKLGQEVRGKVQKASLTELNDFTLQTRLSGEMSYLTLVVLGISRYAVKDWDGAIARFTDALNQVKEPVSSLNQSTIYFYRGTSYLYQQKYPQAITDYTRAIELQPDNADAYYNRAIAYFDQQQYPQAIAEYTRAIELKPDLAGAYNNRGNAYRNQQKYPQAISDYTKAIELQPDNADAYYNRAIAYFDQQQYPQAITDYTRAIELKPDYADAYYNRGNTYAAQQKYPQAITDYTRAISLQPDNADAYYNRGNTYAAQQQYPQAITDYTRAISLQPDNADAYYNRGLAYRNKKDKRNAIKDFKKALELTQDPDFRKDAQKELLKLGVK